MPPDNDKDMETRDYGIEVVVADITTLTTDAIVNAANSTLLGGGGVDGAIHRAAGPRLFEECKALHGCPTGQSRITGAYNLPCRYVIHTVGPVWRSGDDRRMRELLASCYRTSLKLAGGYGIKSIAFPCISTGAYFFPRKEAAETALSAIEECLRRGEYDGKVIICCFKQEDAQIYRECLRGMRAFPPQ